MSQEVKSRILVMARKSKLSEMNELLKSSNLSWTECRHSSGDTALHAAAQSGNIPVMRYLLEQLETDTNTVDMTNLAGKTALHEACQNAQPDAVSYLLKRGANARAIKQADWTPLMLACTKTGKNALACCRLLLEAGGLTLLNDRNKDGWNALHIAAREGDTSIVKELLQADVDSKQASVQSNNGRTPLHTAALHGCSQVVEQLLGVSTVNCNAKDSCGSTPLHDAVRSGNLDTFNALVRAGADLTVQNNEGYGILHMAAQTGQVEMLQYLIKDLHLPFHLQCNHKTTPLHCAVRAGQKDIVKFLLDAGHDPNTMDSWGRSCYDIIPDKNSTEIKNIWDSVQR